MENYSQFQANPVGRPSRVQRDTRDIDCHVGRRIRERRTMLGLTQLELAKLIGVTYQQAHKYEKGINRISAGRLYGIAKVLSVDIDYFFEGVEGDTAPLDERQRMCLDLARNFSKIENDRHQDVISQLCRVLVETEN